MGSWGDTHSLEIAPEPKQRWATKSIYETASGSMLCGETEKLLRSDRLKEMHKEVQLVFTSPPFPLNTKKKYGNRKGQEYIDWFAAFARPLRKLLTPDGSIVVEIGNAWEPGHPVMSTVVLRALLAFLEAGGLKLCQEFVWYNPARLGHPSTTRNPTMGR